MNRMGPSTVLIVMRRLLVIVLCGCGGVGLSAGAIPASLDDAAVQGPVEVDEAGLDAAVAEASGKIDGGGVDSAPDVVGGAGDAIVADVLDVGLDSSGVIDSGNVIDSSVIDSNLIDACATSVPVIHNNGLGQTWIDCVPRGTHNEAQAFKACAAALGGNPTACGPHDADAGGCPDAVFYVGGLWVYEGSTAGYVSPSAFTCPTQSSPMWD